MNGSHGTRHGLPYLSPYLEPTVKRIANYTVSRGLYLEGVLYDIRCVWSYSQNRSLRWFSPCIKLVVEMFPHENLAAGSSCCWFTSAVATSWPRITNMNRTTSWISPMQNAGTDTSSEHDASKQQVPSYKLLWNWHAQSGRLIQRSICCTGFYKQDGWNQLVFLLLCKLVVKGYRRLLSSAFCLGMRSPGRCWKA